MKLPLLILSDLHLGHTASRIDQVSELLPLFEGVGTVVLNGDTWEELAQPWRARSAEMLDELKALLKENGSDLVLLRGNHDPCIFTPPLLELAGGKIAITHGDALLRDSSPWKREIIDEPELIDDLWEKFPNAETDINQRFEVARAIAQKLASKTYPRRRRLLNRILDAGFPPKRAIEMIRAWTGQAEAGARFCETYLPAAQFLIIGHFHWSCCRERRGKTVINSGSFVAPNSAWWVTWDGEHLERGHITKRASYFCKKSKTESWRIEQ